MVRQVAEERGYGARVDKQVVALATGGMEGSDDEGEVIGESRILKRLVEGGDDESERARRLIERCQ